jgi:hypothetical protein
VAIGDWCINKRGATLLKSDKIVISRRRLCRKGQKIEQHT